MIDGCANVNGECPKLCQRELDTLQSLLRSECQCTWELLSDTPHHRKRFLIRFILVVTQVFNADLLLSMGSLHTPEKLKYVEDEKRTRKEPQST